MKLAESRQFSSRHAPRFRCSCIKATVAEIACKNGGVMPSPPNHAEVHPHRYRRANRLVELSALQRAKACSRAGRGTAGSARHHAAEHVWSSAGESHFIVFGAVARACNFKFARKVCMRWPHALFADDLLRGSDVLPRKLPRHENGQLRQGKWHSVRAAALQARWLDLRHLPDKVSRHLMKKYVAQMSSQCASAKTPLMAPKSGSGR